MNIKKIGKKKQRDARQNLEDYMKKNQVDVINATQGPDSRKSVAPMVMNISDQMSSMVEMSEIGGQTVYQTSNTNVSGQKFMKKRNSSIDNQRSIKSFKTKKDSFTSQQSVFKPPTVVTNRKKTNETTSVSKQQTIQVNMMTNE